MVVDMMCDECRDLYPGRVDGSCPHTSGLQRYKTSFPPKRQYEEALYPPYPPEEGLRPPTTCKTYPDNGGVDDFAFAPPKEGKPLP